MLFDLTLNPPPYPLFLSLSLTILPLISPLSCHHHLTLLSPPYPLITIIHLSPPYHNHPLTPWSEIGFGGGEGVEDEGVDGYHGSATRRERDGVVAHFLHPIHLARFHHGNRIQI